MLSMVPAVFQERAEERGQEWFGELVPEPVVTLVVHVASVFPPSIAANGLAASVLREPGHLSKTVAWLVLWTGAGLIIGSRVVRSSLRGGDPSLPAAASTDKDWRSGPTLWTIDLLSAFPAGVRAVAAKEVHYLLRSTTGKFNIVIMPVFVIAMSFLVARDLDRAFLGLDRSSLLFIGLMIYASMFSNNFLFNAYAWDRAGVRSYFLSPVDPSQIVLGKNIGVWLYNLILGLEGLVVFCLASGLPTTSALIGGYLAFVAAVVSATIVGNFLSPVVPVPRDISSVTNSPSQTAVLATIGVLVVNAAVIGACLTIPALLGSAWMGPMVLAVLIVVEVSVYSMMLAPAGRLLESKRESLIEALQE
jgi:hypothetical protein